MTERRRRWSQQVLLCCVAMMACSGENVPEDPEVAMPSSADHHLHIRSQEAAEHLDRMSEALGEAEPGAAGNSAAIPASSVIAALDAAGVEGGLVLSNAYMFGMPDVDTESEADLVRAENEYVASQVALFPKRLVAFCSVNPLAEYALQEVEWCGNDARFGGLKLHLANSDVDLREDADIEALAALFRRANALELPLIVHMRTREPAYGALDAQRFIDLVLSQAPDVPIQIAHMAGWGGYDEGTDAALGAFVSALDSGELTSRFTFGLGAVVFEPAAAGADTALAQRVRSANEQLAERIQQLGVERVVYATDWPSWPPVADPLIGIAANIRQIRSTLPLSESEIEGILANVGPHFEALRR